MSEEKSLAVRSTQIIRTMDDAERAAIAMAKSGYFADSQQASQALVKILAGQEMGFGAFASMNGIHIIKGKPGVGANLQASAVKGSGKYDYKIRALDDKICKIEYFQGAESLGISQFTIEDAKRAGTQNLDKFPRNMLFARAMSNGVKWFCPDVFNGSTVYTPEELGADVNEDGDVITVIATPAPEPKPYQKPEKATNGNGVAPVRPYDPETLKNGLIAKADKLKNSAPLGHEIKEVAACLDYTLGGSDKRHELQKWLTGSASLKDGLMPGMLLALHAWLKPDYDKENGVYIPDPTAAKEAHAAHTYALQAQGQETLI